MKRMSSAYIWVKETRGLVPGTTCNGARTNSAINNSQNSGYVRAPEYYTVHWGSGAPVLRHQAPRAVDLVLRRNYRDVTCWRHTRTCTRTCKFYIPCTLDLTCNIIPKIRFIILLHQNWTLRVIQTMRFYWENYACIFISWACDTVAKMM